MGNILYILAKIYIMQLHSQDLMCKQHTHAKKYLRLIMGFSLFIGKVFCRQIRDIKFELYLYKKINHWLSLMIKNNYYKTDFISWKSIVFVSIKKKLAHKHKSFCDFFLKLNSTYYIYEKGC